MRDRINRVPAITNANSPAVLGTGLLALDIVKRMRSTEPVRYWAGGTCGNVLTSLAYLGWKAFPIARLKNDAASEQIKRDLRHWNVSLDFITSTSDGSTPIIVEKIYYPKDGTPYHSYSWRCPECGSRFPSFKPVLASHAEIIATNIGNPRVFFFDRVTRGALTLAKACLEKGAVIFFEPSSVDNPALFREAWALAHVVKYSHERLSDFACDEFSGNILLQIETLGREGLRFRSRLPNARKAWGHLDAFKIKNLKDAAGCGDWCSAGLIHKLASEGLKSFRDTTLEDLRKALQFGQALAAWNCTFEGARGGMYRVSQRDFPSQVAQILSGEVAADDLNANKDVTSLCNALPCAACGNSTSRRRKQGDTKRAKVGLHLSPEDE